MSFEFQLIPIFKPQIIPKNLVQQLMSTAKPVQHFSLNYVMKS